MSASLKSLLQPVLKNLPQFSSDTEVEVLRELPVETLYLALKEADTDTALWFFENALPEQIQGMVDIDCWEGPTFLPERFEEHFKSMTTTDTERLAELMKSIDPEVLIRSLLEWVSVEDFDPQNPPEVDEHKLLLTLDSKYALILKTENPEIREMLLLWINKLSAGNMDLLRRHLESCKWEQPSDLEEYGYQFKKGRIEDMGFVDYFEAIAIYRRGSAAQLKAELLANPLDSAAKYPPELFPGEDTEAFVESEFLPQVIAEPMLGDGLLRDAIRSVEDPRKRQVLLMEMLRTVNAALSADKVIHGTLEQISICAKRARRYLDLGLIYLSDGSKERAVELILVQPLAEVYHLGWLTCQDLVNACRGLTHTYGNSLFSEKDQEIFSQLSGRHPELPLATLKEFNLAPEPGTLLSTKSLLVVGQHLAALAQYAQFFISDMERSLELKTRPLVGTETALARLLTGLFRQAAGSDFKPAPLNEKEFITLAKSYDKQQMQKLLQALIEHFPAGPRILFKDRITALCDDLNFYLSSHAQPKKPDVRFFRALVFES